MSLTKPLILSLSIGLLALVSCCGPRYNLPKQDGLKPPQIDSVKQDESALVFASFSGGGTRAACMSWETLKYLKKIPYKYQDSTGCWVNSNLAEQIDYISGISGGSFAATAWCIYKDSMEAFDAKFINRNIQLELLLALLHPDRLIQSFSDNYSRTDIASEFYDKNVFNHTYFNQLSGYPVLWVGSTVLAIGLQFVYTQDYFDFLSSDLGSYPVAYACAASSAFPILLCPMTLKNYGPTLSDSALKAANNKYRIAKMNSIDFEKYFYCKTVEFMNDKKNRWIHVADGGISDNQGLQIVLDQFQTNGIINKACNNATPEKPLKRLIFINVNSGDDKIGKGDQKVAPPNAVGVITDCLTISLDRLSAKRWEEIKVRSDDKKFFLSQNGVEMEAPYFIEINYRNADENIKSEYRTVPVNFDLNKKQREFLRNTIPVLLDQSEDLTRLKLHIK